MIALHLGVSDLSLSVSLLFWRASRDGGSTLSGDWSPDFQPHKWARDKAEFAAWMDGATVRAPWKRNRFTIWRREQHVKRAHDSAAVARKQKADRIANPSAELVAAYQELQAAEAASGARLGCARGGDMSDPETVRAIARLLNDHADKFQ